MKQITGLLQRKALLAAMVIVLGGCAAIIWTLAGMLSHVAQPPIAAAAEDVGSDVLDPTEELSPPATSETSEASDTALIVYISGAVVAPDVYRLPAGARIKDLVVAAGGFSSDADAESVNLAARLSDAQHLRVPRRGELSQPANPVADPASTAEPANGLIDLNGASAAELDGLPGIGQTTAERIIAYRTANGPFGSVEDLRKVKGIGPTLYERIAPLVMVGH